MVKEFMDLRLLELGGTPISVATVVVLVVVLLLSWWLARLLERATKVAMRGRGVKDDGSVKAVGRLVHYAVLLVGFGVGFQTAGFSLDALFAAGAVFAVGLGFAFQNLAQNFVSGIILLVERTITPGDVLEVEGRVVRVVQMRMRTTVARTRDEEDLIIPNSTLVQSTVKNFSLDDSVYRLRASVGVPYDSDMAQVRTVLEETARAVPWRLQSREPSVEMFELAASSVVWRVNVWMEDPWRSSPCACDLNERLWFALKSAGISLAYPQLDVHLDRAALDALRAGGQRS